MIVEMNRAELPKVMREERVERERHPQNEVDLLHLGGCAPDQEKTPSASLSTAVASAAVLI